METVTISKKEYKQLKDKAEMSEGLLLKLFEGLEDVKHGRLKPLKSRT